MPLIKGLKRLDKSTVTSKVEVTPQGFLKAPVSATRTGVFVYMRGGQVHREARLAKHVFDPESMKTIRFIPFTADHPMDMVTPENVRAYLTGMTSDRAEKVKHQLETDVIIMDGAAIEDVKGGKVQVSCGYDMDLEETPGVFMDPENQDHPDNGKAYDAIQTNIIYNHLANVMRGRMGKDTRVRLDALDENYNLVDSKDGAEDTPANETKTPHGGAMKTWKGKDGKEVQVEDSVYDALTSMSKACDDLKAENETLKKDKKDDDDEEKEGADKKDRKDAAEAKAEVERLKGENEALRKKGEKTLDQAEVTKQANERMTIMQVAQKVMKAEDLTALKGRMDTLDNVALMSEVLKADDKDFKPEGKSADYIRGLFTPLQKTEGARKDKDEAGEDLGNLILGAQRKDGDKTFDAVKAEKENREKLSGKWKEKVGTAK